MKEALKKFASLIPIMVPAALLVISIEAFLIDLWSYWQLQIMPLRMIDALLFGIPSALMFMMSGDIRRWWFDISTIIVFVIFGLGLVVHEYMPRTEMILMSYICVVFWSVELWKIAHPKPSDEFLESAFAPLDRLLDIKP